MALPCCRNVEIPRVSAITKEEFIEKHLAIGCPVILERVTDDWLAKEWTIDGLCDLVGDNPISVRTNTNCTEYKLGKKYAIRETTFRKYVTDLKANNKKSHNSYMAVQNIRKAFHQLEDQVKVPEYVGKLHGGPYLWIAPEGHYEYCHFDPDEGFLVVISGRKDIKLFGCNLDPMYPNPLGSKGRTVQATVNCETPDLEIHQKFDGVTCYHAQLGPGDMLYIPAFWWHQVTSPEITISINMFWGDAGSNTYISKVMRDARWPAFRHWLLNVVEQNLTYPAWPRTLSRLPEALHHFILKQWHETATEEQLNSLVSEIMQHLHITELPSETSSGKYPPPLQIRGLVWRS